MATERVQGSCAHRVGLFRSKDKDGKSVLVTAEFDLAEMAGKATGATTTVNGPKHIDAVIEAQRDQLATLQALGDRSATTKAAEATAWMAVKDQVQNGLLGVDKAKLPVKVDLDYATDEENVQEDAVGLIDRILDALSSEAKLLAALDPDGTGIFNYYDTGKDDDPDTKDVREDQGSFITYDTAERRYETKTKDFPKTNGRTLGNVMGERQYKVITALGTTDYTRFGAWRRESTKNAFRVDGVEHKHGGPGTFAYSALDPTQAGTKTNPGFPEGGSASYAGETVAIQNTTVLTGTVRVDVTWNDLVTDKQQDLGGMMTLTIGDLANADGDPLMHNGGTTGDAASPTLGDEIADIVFSGIGIAAGLAGANSGHLIVGKANEDNDDKDLFTYEEVALMKDDVRYRLTAAGMPDVTDREGEAAVKALFVGQGVDGPLGVISTWSLTDKSVGRVHANGFKVADQGSTIHGAFGAELP